MKSLEALNKQPFDKSLSLMPWVDLNHNPPGKTQPGWPHEFYISIIFQHMLVKESKQQRDLSSSIPAR